jgi:hypothetical protein
MVEMAVRLYQEHLKDLSERLRTQWSLLSSLLCVLLERCVRALGQHPARRFCQCFVQQFDNGEMQTYAANVRSSHDDDILKRRSHDLRMCYVVLMKKRDKISGLI